MAKCIFSGCPNEANKGVTIDLGERFDDDTVIAPETRLQRVNVCDDHAAVFAEQVNAGFRKIGVPTATATF